MWNAWLKRAVGKLRRHSIAGFHDVLGGVDHVRLATRHRTLVPDRLEQCAIADMLRPVYSEYVKMVSTPEMAVSLETAAYLYYLCMVRKPARALDLGSGFSSYVFRRYASEASHPMHVTSVDDDAEWLARTQRFVQRHRVQGANFELWNHFSTDEPAEYDLVFHDLASGELRERAMSVAVARVSHGGSIVFDDAHHAGHRARMFAECKMRDLRVFRLRRLTLDSAGRWAVLGLRGPREMSAPRD